MVNYRPFYRHRLELLECSICSLIRTCVDTDSHTLTIFNLAFALRLKCWIIIKCNHATWVSKLFLANKIITFKVGRFIWKMMITSSVCDEAALVYFAITQRLPFWYVDQRGLVVITVEHNTLHKTPCTLHNRVCTAHEVLKLKEMVICTLDDAGDNSTFMLCTSSHTISCIFVFAVQQYLQSAVTMEKAFQTHTVVVSAHVIHLYNWTFVQGVAQWKRLHRSGAGNQAANMSLVLGTLGTLYIWQHDLMPTRYIVIFNALLNCQRCVQS